MNQSGHVALITGSTDGVGRRVAERLAAGGTTVLVHGRDSTRGESLVRQLQAAGAAARFYRADLASLAEVHALAEAVQRPSTSPM